MHLVSEKKDKNLSISSYNQVFKTNETSLSKGEMTFLH